MGQNITMSYSWEFRKYRFLAITPDIISYNQEPYVDIRAHIPNGNKS
jgi:hypothetical protein